MAVGSCFMRRCDVSGGVATTGVAIVFVFVAPVLNYRLNGASFYLSCSFYSLCESLAELERSKLILSLADASAV
jgi:hypothetical protein